jgi:hypothetical protein
MWVFLCIAISMVHPVHYGIGPWHQIGRTLYKPSGYIENPFPGFAGGVHLMGCKPVQKEGMEKQ